MTAPTKPTLGIRHAVLWVSDPAASAAFYEQALGLVVKASVDGSMFMSSSASATDHDLGLFPAASATRPAPRQIGMYHLSWEVGTLAELVSAKTRLAQMGALTGESDHGVSRSIYAQDPDGLEFEVMWEVPENLLTADDSIGVRPLNLVADGDRFGVDTPGRGAR